MPQYLPHCISIYCHDSRDALLMVLFQYLSDIYLLSATFASSKPSLEWVHTWRNFIIDSGEYGMIEDFCSNRQKRNSLENYSGFLIVFLGTGMTIAFFRCVGASS